MIKKIVCASFGTENSEDIINFIVSIAEKFKSEIILLYVKPKPYFEGLDYIPGEESKLYSNWIEDITEKEINKLKKIAVNVVEKGLKCNIEVIQGVLHEEIVDFASEENADLIALSKKRCPDHDSPINRTVLKLVRHSDIPVITLNRSDKQFNINNILVPTGLNDLNPHDLKYAFELSEFLYSKIYQLNILETEDYNFPAELVFKYMDDAYKIISKMKFDYENVEQHVIESINAYSGISKFLENNNIDLIVMNTYRGEQGEKKDFIGSIAERILQTVECPVITIRPS